MTVPGIPVVVSALLPSRRVPTHLDDAVRIVRHGLADVLDWLDEPVGPCPGEVVEHHLVFGLDGAAGDGDGGMVAMVSRELYERLKDQP